MNIFITGGTSGIGLGLAIHYLEKGHRVGICGRDISKVDDELVKKNSKLELFQLDVYNKNSLVNAVNTFSGGNLDLMIACAGSYANSRTALLTRIEATDMLKINVVGTLNAIEAASEIMVEKGSGHIIAIASVAGLMNYPGASVYSSTKGAVIKICKTYNTALSEFGVSVSVIAPGYIDTEKLRELNNNDISKKPFVVPLDYAVKKITESIENKKIITVFPLRMKILVSILNILPEKLLALILIRKKR
ncbi:MAG: SDR family NAD(P)-dependent oxidoreductase [Desulfobacterales bacterium]|nr:SDR family NAD(P)-dependent oxidoreductase [Desulfobacterales bacterium]